MDYKQIVLAIAAALGLGYGIGRYIQPAKTEIKFKEVTKEVEVTNKNIVVTEKTVKKVDGTVETIKITEDKTVVSSKKETEVKVEKAIENLKPQWKASALVLASLKDKPTFGALIERRIAGPMFVGLQGYTNGTFGLSVGMEF